MFEALTNFGSRPLGAGFIGGFGAGPSVSMLGQRMLDDSQPTEDERLRNFQAQRGAGNYQMNLNDWAQYHAQRRSQMN
jgi:hypothetical protein